MTASSSYWPAPRWEKNETAFAVAQAFNDSNIGALRAALAQEPQLRSMKLVKRKLARGKKKTAVEMSLEQVAVALGWAEPLALLWELGERFAGEPGQEPLLTQATREARAACVDVLLGLGMDPNQPHGNPPLAQLGYMKEGAMTPRRKMGQIVRAYVKAGVDPLALTKTLSGLEGIRTQARALTLVETFLQQGDVGSGATLLKQARRQGLDAAILREHAEIFWNTVEWGSAVYFKNHIGNWKTPWASVREDYRRVLELALHFQLPAPKDLVAGIGMSATGNLRSQYGGMIHDRKKGLQVASDMGRFVAELWPDEHEIIETFTSALLNFSDELDPGEASFWQAHRLSGQTTLAKSRTSTVRL